MMLGIDFVNVFVYRDGSDNFTSQLLRLYMKADLTNKAKLASVYPKPALLYEWWMQQQEPPSIESIMEKAHEIERGQN